MQARAASWRLSEGKQVLAAKCAFSEQRNDCYVLAAVIAGTLPRVRLPLQQRLLLLWMECLLFQEAFGSVHVQQATGIKVQQAAHKTYINSLYLKTCSLPDDSECRFNTLFDGLIWYLTQIFTLTPPETCLTETCWWVLVPLYVGRRRNLTGLCYGWTVLLYYVNRHNC